MPNSKEASAAGRGAFLANAAHRPNNDLSFFLGNTIPQRRIIRNLQTDGGRDLVHQIALILRFLPQKRIQKSGFSRIESKLAPFEKHVNRFPQRVIQDLDDLLMHQRIVRDTVAKSNRPLYLDAAASVISSPRASSRAQNRRDFRIATRRSKTHHHVGGFDDGIQAGADEA